MPPGFRFIDLPSSAERLGVTRHRLLELVDEGRIKPFSGRGQQSIFRAADVDALAAELTSEAVALVVTEEQAAAAEESAVEATPGRRPRRRDPIKLMGTRLSMDSRWAEISDADIATWLDALEPIQYERVRKVARLAVERLEHVLRALDEFERRPKS